KGEYSEGYAEIMKTYPDLRRTPDHPRKDVPASTLSQHRTCIATCVLRIRASLCSGKLPEGYTLDQAHNEVMKELEESVVETGRSDPVPFKWDLSQYDLFQYDLQGGAKTVGQRSKVEAVGAAPGWTRGRGSREQRATDVPRGAPRLRVEVGEFVVCAMPVSIPMAVTVGKILDTRSGDDGEEALLCWFTPKSVKANAPRSRYGRAGWSAEHIIKQRKLVPSTDWEVVAAVSAKFARLINGDKLRRHVWQAVAKNVPAEADEEEEQEEE
ncbi:unnamed protein product, partial [Discosporangium mesarthrocarpum]